jgi:hypothetical protein
MWRCSSHPGAADEPASSSHDRRPANPYLTPNTQRVYVEQVVCFARHFRQSPERLGPAEIRVYLLHLANERASSIIVSVSALRFFYTVTLKRPWIVEDDISVSRTTRALWANSVMGSWCASIGIFR